jgi:S-adenosylmethionine synthetase
MGEISTEAHLDYDRLARRVITQVGYDNSEKGFDGNTCGVQVAVAQQSEDISRGVDEAYEVRDKSDGGDQASMLGAGDQGMMFGFACDETESLMPLPIDLAHRLAKRLALVRVDGDLEWLRPDGKTQVTVEYSGGRPKRVRTVLVSAQHAPQVTQAEIHKAITEQVIRPTLPADLSADGLEIFVNPTGRFVTGGPLGDSGLTGRKIIVDTYGGMGRHGGGCFSGKDPTKVDRSGAYAARWVAKHIVAAGLAARCEIQVAYAIGVSKPISVNVETFGTGVLPDEDIARVINEIFDLRPGAIIRDLDLRRPIYEPTAVYGHFGRDDIDSPWEQLDRVEAVKEAAGLPERVLK